MKKILLMALAVAAFAFVGCSDDDDAQVASSAIEVVKSQVGFEAEGGQGTIELKVNASAGAVTAASSKDWVVINSADAKAVTYTVGVSTEAMLRTADITIKAGKEEQVVTILQNGSRFTISTEPVEVDPSGETSLTIPYQASNSVLPEVTIPDDAKEWLTAEVTAEGIKLTGALNYMADRQTTIAVKQGWKPQEIVVNQGTVNLIEASGDAYDAATSTISQDANPVTFMITPTKYISHVTEPWTIEADADWIQMSDPDASGNYTVNVPMNDTNKKRSGKVSLLVNGLSVSTITVIQGDWSFESLEGAWTATWEEDNGGTVTAYEAEITLAANADKTGYVMSGMELPGVDLTFSVVSGDPVLTIPLQGFWRNSSYYFFIGPLASDGYYSWSPNYIVQMNYTSDGKGGAQFTIVDSGTWPGKQISGAVIVACSQPQLSSDAVLGWWSKWNKLTFTR